MIFIAPPDFILPLFTRSFLYATIWWYVNNTLLGETNGSNHDSYFWSKVERKIITFHNNWEIQVFFIFVVSPCCYHILINIKIQMINLCKWGTEQGYQLLVAIVKSAFQEYGRKHNPISKECTLKFFWEVIYLSSKRQYKV